VILSNREKDSKAELAAFRERALVESRLDDMKKDVAFFRVRAVSGSAFALFLVLILPARITAT
jgi:hypothetical protein